MDHIAIMKKKWKLLPLIETGVKTVESRWYKNRSAPWDRIYPKDIIYFKNSGDPITLKATVTKVEQYEIEDNTQALVLMQKYAYADLGAKKLNQEIKSYILNKKYAVFVFFDRVEKVEPFEIDKSGFGMQCAWMVVGNITDVRV